MSCHGLPFLKGSPVRFCLTFYAWNTGLRLRNINGLLQQQNLECSLLGPCGGWGGSFSSSCENSFSWCFTMLGFSIWFPRSESSCFFCGCESVFKLGSSWTASGWKFTFQWTSALVHLLDGTEWDTLPSGWPHLVVSTLKDKRCSSFHAWQETSCKQQYSPNVAVPLKEHKDKDFSISTKILFWVGAGL